MSKRPAEHINAQRAGKLRDGNVCQICGTKHNIEGHHIVDVQHGGAASEDNIIALCHKHHRAVHNGEIEIKKM